MKLNTIIISQNFPPIEGGIQTYMFELAKNWDMGEVKVICELVGNEFSDYSFEVRRIKNIKTRYPVCIYRLFKILFKTSKLSVTKIITFIYLIINRTILTKTINLMKEHDKIVKKNKKYIIQCSKPLYIGAIGLLFKAIYNIDYIVYIHGTELNTYSDNWRINILYKYIMRNAKLVVSNSNYTKALAIEKGAVRKNIIVRNLGANINDFFPIDSRDKICEQFKIDKKSTILLTISHLVERKGHLLILEAMKNLILKNYSLHYLIIGQGEFGKNIQREIQKLDLNDYVTLVGFTPSNSLNYFMNACDIYVMPNRQVGPDFEGFGIAFLEANACKKPVIGGRSGGVSDAILDGETGFLVDPYNISEITKKIESLIVDAELAQRLGENGYNRVIKTNNWKDVCKKINSIIKLKI